MRPTLERIIRDAKSLPTMPTVVARMAAMLDDDTSGAAEFERLVHPDPSLTANLLRLANSPFFGARRQIGTVRQAIAFLGTERVFELAASAWFSKTLPRRIPGYDVSAKSLWLHSVAVGVLNETLAVAAHLRPPDMAFTAGLLHDVGKLAVGSFLAEHIDRVYVEINHKNRPFLEAEREVLGLDHSDVGGILCDQWDLPPCLGSAAAWHHTPSLAPETVDQELIDLTHLSDALAHSMGFGSDVGELSRTIDPLVLERLIVDDTIIQSAVTENVMSQIWEMGELVAGGISC